MHQCGTGQKPSEGQVNEWEISKNSIVRELRIFYVPEKKGGLVLIQWQVVNQDPSEVGIFPCKGDLVLGFSRFQDAFPYGEDAGT